MLISSQPVISHVGMRPYVKHRWTTKPYEFCKEKGSYLNSFQDKPSSRRNVRGIAGHQTQVQDLYMSWSGSWGQIHTEGMGSNLSILTIHHQPEKVLEANIKQKQ